MGSEMCIRDSLSVIESVVIAAVDRGSADRGVVVCGYSVSLD